MFTRLLGVITQLRTDRLLAIAAIVFLYCIYLGKPVYHELKSAWSELDEIDSLKIELETLSIERMQLLKYKEAKKMPKLEDSVLSIQGLGKILIPRYDLRVRVRASSKKKKEEGIKDPSKKRDKAFTLDMVKKSGPYGTYKLPLLGKYVSKIFQPEIEIPRVVRFLREIKGKFPAELFYFRCEAASKLCELSVIVYGE